MGLCHCRSCQYSTSSAYYPFLAIAADSFNISGEYKEYLTTGDSGKPVHRCFCPNCGTFLFGHPESRPNLRTVSASTLDDPTIFKPEIAVWLAEAQPWDCTSPTIKKFDKHPV
jgi:hypothetical protein